MINQYCQLIINKYSLQDLLHYPFRRDNYEVIYVTLRHMQLYTANA